MGWWDRYHPVVNPSFLHGVAKGRIAGAFAVHKFGRNADVDAAEDVWSYGGDYTYPSAAATNYISSSNAGDDQEITIEGLDADWNKQTATQALDGQNKTEIGSGLTWMRVFRAYNIGTDLAGDAYVYEDDTLTAGVPDTATKVKAKVDQAENQSLMALYTIPNGYEGFLLTLWVNGNGVTATNFDLSLLEKQSTQGSFRTQFTCSGRTDGAGIYMPYELPRVIPEKTDIRWRCTAVSAANLDISAGFDLALYQQ
jgi:hypothetical protein